MYVKFLRLATMYITIHHSVIYLSISTSTYLPTYLSIYLSIYLSENIYFCCLYKNQTIFLFSGAYRKKLNKDKARAAEKFKFFLFYRVVVSARSSGA